MSSFVYNAGTYTEVEKDILTLEFGLFFDGTNNNKLHTDARKLKKLKTSKQTPAAQKELMRLNRTYDKRRQEELQNIYDENTESESSYESDHTNVARMFLHTEDKTYAIYIEGIGTKNEQTDSTQGYAYGRFSTGVVAKVKKGTEELAERIKKKFDDAIKGKNNKNHVVKSLDLTLDVFGFSRGAAAARHFLYQLTLLPQKHQIILPVSTPGTFNEVTVIRPKYGFLGEKLQEIGFHEDFINKINIKVRFAGLYDTVASYDNSWRLIPNFSKGIKELHLDTLGNPQLIVHFTAMDECRKNFALTRVKHANKIEKNLPGVHSDIGGSYDCDGIEPIEKCILGENKASLKELEHLRRWFINEGWYQDKEIKAYDSIWPVNNQLIGERHGPDFGPNSGTGLTGAYSYLILGWMCDYASFCIENKNIRYEDIVLYYDFTALDDSKKTLSQVKKFLEHNTFKALKEAQKQTMLPFPGLKIQRLLMRKEAALLSEHDTVKEWKLIGDKVTTEKNTDPASPGVINMDGVTITAYQSDMLLKRLRNCFLHQSAHYKPSLFGLVHPHEPAPGRIRPVLPG